MPGIDAKFFFQPDKISNISDAEFQALRDIMYRTTGVSLPPTKKPLVVTRLHKRLKELHIDNFRDYLKLIQEPKSPELEVFVNAITTNETFFYRHPEQFDFLMKTALPALLENAMRVSRQELKIWSAACSTGEEPYTISIACNEFLKHHPGWKFVIYASDINSAVLEFSKKAIYRERSLSKMPPSFRALYFDPIAMNAPYKMQEYQLHADVVASVRFLHHNLLELFPFGNMDIIFLRNTMIYFDRVSKQKVVHLVEKKLLPGGYFFTSMAESLLDVQSNLGFVQMGIYRKNE